ncbi:hypothetical protein PCANC_26968 [Puccinia coronata f. sp. avenae]|uniref:Uncharacterized protein n=1 Tax=Puccinia coronata f. sp. avenae TaxID=200324 RepID=A0A2N5RWP1_9BASI|nr:hypothetical protein PCANC_26968 [Puccinia coronata f. sp. avenae]
MGADTQDDIAGVDAQDDTTGADDRAASPLELESLGARLTGLCSPHLNEAHQTSLHCTLVPTPSDSSCSAWTIQCM